MASVFVTGGSGFFGSLLIPRLLGEGHKVTNIDLVPCTLVHPRLRSIEGDIRDGARLGQLLGAERHDVVFHCAAALAHGSMKSKELWSSNVDGTRTLAEAVAAAGVPLMIYTSSNCLWGNARARPVGESDAPDPVELYGLSKWEGEKILDAHKDRFASVIIRCPTIMDEGRLGLLGILFEFIADNRRVWVVGGGANRYQFIYAQDLIDAMMLAWTSGRPNTFGIGSDNVLSMRDTFQYVIDQAASRSKVTAIPKWPTIAAMKVAHHLRLSPLGPYHYRMIAADFMFDTSHIKQTLGWRPTLSNHEMLHRAYRYYAAHRTDIQSRTQVSAHRKAAGMGVIRLLKWVS